MDRIRVGIFFGGNSREREISFAGGRTVFDNLNKAIFEPIPIGAKVRISAKAMDKFIKRERRYVRHEVTVEDVTSGLLYMRETRDILSL
jgi:D-alanine-D-alanine ligase-like ATP-grasp enzyme